MSAPFFSISSRSFSSSCRRPSMSFWMLARSFSSASRPATPAAERARTRCTSMKPIFDVCAAAAGAGAGACAAVPDTSIATAATATTETTAAFIHPSSKGRAHRKMEIPRFLSRSLVEVEAVVYPDRAERRHPAHPGAGRFAQVGQVELGLEAIHVADVEEGGHPQVEGQRHDVLEVAEGLAGAADARPGLVLRRDLPYFEAPDRVGTAEVEALEHRQPLVAEAETVTALDAPREDVAEPDGLEVRGHGRGLGEVVVAPEAGHLGPDADLPALARCLDAVAAVPGDRARPKRGDRRARLVGQEGVGGIPQVQDLVIGEAIAEVPAPELLEGMAQAQAAADGVVVVLDELPPRAEKVEPRRQRTVEQPWLGEADLSLLHVGARPDLDAGHPAAAEKVVL